MSATSGHILTYVKRAPASMSASPNQQTWSQTQTLSLQSCVFSFIISAAGHVTFDIVLLVIP